MSIVRLSSLLVVSTAVVLALCLTVSITAFVIVPTATTRYSVVGGNIQQQTQQQQQSKFVPLYLSDNQQSSSSSSSPESSTTSAFASLDDEDDDEDEDVSLDKVEMLGRGAAKIKRGKRKGSSSTSSTPKVVLEEEVVYYEGPPAITETIVPTISILTVVGIIPAAAAWARQAWVRYKITSRRIRVQSGIGGKEMAEIVYPDIIEIRTVKRLFGDGDMVLFLRDGAKFEMRNIPEFDLAMEFMLKYVAKDVAETYRSKGDVGKN